MANISFDDLPSRDGKSGGISFDDLPSRPDPKKAAAAKSDIFANAPAPLRFFNDLTTASMDAATRGWGSKLFGQATQDETQREINRLPAAAAVPAEAVTALATSPYRVGSTGVGALAGGLEGAASAYGHQPNWVPDIQGGLDIAKGAIAGTVAGAGGAKTGEWLGNLGGRVPNPAAGQPNLLGRIGQHAEPLSLYGTGALKRAPLALGADYLLTHLGVPPGVTSGGATALNALGRTRLAQQGATMGNPTVAAPTRDALAKMLTGMSNYYTR
jgi:hypothetical protein